jgi:hypothetical protein
MSTPRLINLRGTWINPEHVVRVFDDGPNAGIGSLDGKITRVGLSAEEVATIINKEFARAETAARVVLQHS